MFKTSFIYSEVQDVSVSGRRGAHGIVRDFGAGRVYACKILDVAVVVHLKHHNGLFHSFLMRVGGVEEIV